MIIKVRTTPLELVLLQIIQSRMKVSEKVENRIYSLEKGFIGEKMFDQYLKKLSCVCLIINDLLLETNNTHYQIDSLLLSQYKIHIFEVKNFEGDYTMNGEIWKTQYGMEVKNPLIQLSRCESLLRQLLQKAGINLKVEAHLVFINPEFHLYHSSPDLPIIYPSQINRFMNNLNSESSKLNNTHHIQAKKLLDLHVKKSPFSLLPEYSFEGLAKGILCLGCGDLHMSTAGSTTTFTCKKCGFVENKETAILRSIKEFVQLFPETKITSAIITAWCNIKGSRSLVQKVLSKYYNPCSSKRGTYYTKRGN